MIGVGYYWIIETNSLKDDIICCIILPSYAGGSHGGFLLVEDEDEGQEQDYIVVGVLELMVMKAI